MANEYVDPETDGKKKAGKKKGGAAAAAKEADPEPEAEAEAEVDEKTGGGGGGEDDLDESDEDEEGNVKKKLVKPSTSSSAAAAKKAINKLTSGESPLFRMPWMRVILDEAHIIRDRKTRQSKAACALKAERLWAVTGTPFRT